MPAKPRNPAPHASRPESPDQYGTGGGDTVKEVNRLIRLARSYWDAHNNLACRTTRDQALALYATLGKEDKDRIPQVLRVWLRYRSEKYFGDHRTPSGGGPARAKSRKAGSGTLPVKTRGNTDSAD